MTKKDIQAIRKVLRHIATSDPALQQEILRIDSILEAELKPKDSK
jgi:hypothetical protein